jgi:hypothetical protein
MTTILSWQDIKLFLTCQRCFYLKHKFKINLPAIDFDYSISSTLDKLCKEKSDFCRITQRTLPIMEINDINAIPFESEIVNVWRTPVYKGGGIQYYDKINKLGFNGNLDDVFIDPEGLVVVEFKTTNLKSRINIKNSYWHGIDKLQVTYYSWLLKNNNIITSPRGYLIYSILFDKSLDFYPLNNTVYFKASIFECNVNYEDIEKIISKITNCLILSVPPVSSRYNSGFIKCKLCKYTTDLVQKGILNVNIN